MSTGDALAERGVVWEDGRACSRCPVDAVDLAMLLTQFSQEAAAVDRKPHGERISCDLAGRQHDPGPKSRLGGRHTQAMLTGQGPGATGLRGWWSVLERSAEAAGARLVQMFCMVASGQGPGATTGEPHADAVRCRASGQLIGSRGTVHLTADDRARREFRVGLVQMEDSGDKTQRVARQSLQPEPGADGRRHLPDGSACRFYGNGEVSILNDVGLGVVKAADGSQTAHEGGIAPIGQPAPDGQCTMHGAVVFSLDRALPSQALRRIAERLVELVIAMAPGLRQTNRSAWEQMRMGHGAPMFGALVPRRRRPVRQPAADPNEVLVSLSVGYDGERFCGPGSRFDPGWRPDPQARELYGPGTVDGQLLLALDRVRLEIDPEASRLAPRPDVFSRAARTDRGAGAVCNVLALPLETSLLGQLPPEELVERVNRQLPDAVRLLRVARACTRFNARADCDTKSYQLAVPVPQPAGGFAGGSQRQLWHSLPSCAWKRQGSGPRCLLAAPMEATALGRQHVEWTVRRTQPGSASPMLRLAVRFERGVWYCSAQGESRCHSRGNCLEYFGCGALADLSQWELRTLGLAGSLWRRMDPDSLRLSSAVPAELPAGVVVAVGVWCDSSPLTGMEKSTYGSSEMDPAPEQRERVLTSMLTAEQRSLIEHLQPAMRLTVQPERALTKQERTALCAAVRALGGQRSAEFARVDGERVLSVQRAGQQASCEVRPPVEVGMVRMVELSQNSPGPSAVPGLSVCCEASAILARLDPVLRSLEGEHRFYSFSPHLKASQRKSQRQLAQAACTGFLLQHCGPAEWRACVLLGFAARGFLFGQVEHMAGAALMIADQQLPPDEIDQAFASEQPISLPRVQAGGLSLQSCCYRRKLPGPDASPVWVGPRAWGGTGVHEQFSGEVGMVLDWRAELLSAQVRRMRAAKGWHDCLVPKSSSDMCM